MPDLPPFLKAIFSALIYIGALAACSAAPTPVLIPTSTLVPSTATYTPTPPEPSATARPSETPVVSPSPSYIPLIETTLIPDSGLTNRIIQEFASELAIPGNRIQLVSIETEQFSSYGLDCIPTSGGFVEPSSDRVEGYRYILLVGASLYEYHTEGSDVIQRCPFTAPLVDELLILVDPFAADTFRLVQNRLATELDISSRRILLVSMRAVVWQDTSLGCPLEDQNYNAAEVVGYRIVVTAGEQAYIYHSDSTNVYPCLAENEVFSR